jgi:hypothetical protein
MTIEEYFNMGIEHLIITGMGPWEGHTGESFDEACIGEAREFSNFELRINNPQEKKQHETEQAEKES